MTVKKQIIFDKRAIKEMTKFPILVQEKFATLFVVLKKDGFLKEPFGKRINNEMFELRVKHRGQWRILYAYLGKIEIIILSGFHKKTQKTPKEEIKKALHRLNKYK